MDPIKEAFQKVKDDMSSLKEELEFIKKELAELKTNSYENSNKKPLNNDFQQKDITSNNQNQDNFKTDTSTDTSTETSTLRHKNKTSDLDTSTHNYSLEGLKSQNLDFSTRNQGVPTDRQTNRQTNRQTDFEGFKQNSEKKETQYINNSESENFSNTIDNKNLFSNKKTRIQKDQTINNAAEILDSLDSLKKEIRLKFKRLTDQEFSIFSTLYQIDLELGYASYKDISERLNLTESSIRDYIGRLINKGIPVEKNRINNKNIHLKISENLKKIATLPTIIQLRDI